MDGSFFLKAKIFLNILFQSLRLHYFSFLGEALRPSLQQLCANILGYLNTKGLYPSLKVSYLTVIASLENVLSGRLILLKKPTIFKHNLFLPTGCLLRFQEALRHLLKHLKVPVTQLFDKIMCSSRKYYFIPIPRKVIQNYG